MNDLTFVDDKTKEGEEVTEYGGARQEGKTLAAAPRTDVDKASDVPQEHWDQEHWDKLMRDLQESREILTREIELAARTERIYGKDIRVGTIKEFCREILHINLTPGQPAPASLNLGVEKFRDHAGKFYRLIWVGQGQAWLAAENPTPYRTKARALAAGAELAAGLGARFSEVTR